MSEGQRFVPAAFARPGDLIGCDEHKMPGTFCIQCHDWGRRCACLYGDCTLARSEGNWCAVHAIGRENRDEDAPPVCAWPGCNDRPCLLVQRGIDCAAFRTERVLFCAFHVCRESMCPNPIVRTGARMCVQHEGPMATWYKDDPPPPPPAASCACGLPDKKGTHRPRGCTWEQAGDFGSYRTHVFPPHGHTPLPRDPTRLTDLDRRVSALEAMLNGTGRDFGRYALLSARIAALEGGRNTDFGAEFTSAHAEVGRQAVSNLKYRVEALEEAAAQTANRDSRLATAEDVRALGFALQSLDAALVLTAQRADKALRFACPSTDVEGPPACTRCGVVHADQAGKRRHLLTWRGRAGCWVRRTFRRTQVTDGREIIRAAEAACDV